MAYTETLRAVYIIGVPCSILAFAGSLLIKNSKMQTKAEEEEAIRKAREEAAADEKSGDAGDAEKQVKDAVRAEREEEEAEVMTAVGAVPDGAVHGENDAERALGDKPAKHSV